MVHVPFHDVLINPQSSQHHDGFICISDSCTCAKAHAVLAAPQGVCSTFASDGACFAGPTCKLGSHFMRPSGFPNNEVLTLRTTGKQPQWLSALLSNRRQPVGTTGTSLSSHLIITEQHVLDAKRRIGLERAALKKVIKPEAKGVKKEPGSTSASASASPTAIVLTKPVSDVARVIKIEPDSSSKIEPSKVSTGVQDHSGLATFEQQQGVPGTTAARLYAAHDSHGNKLEQRRMVDSPLDYVAPDHCYNHTATPAPSPLAPAETKGKSGKSPEQKAAAKARKKQKKAQKLELAMAVSPTATTNSQSDTPAAPMSKPARNARKKQKKAQKLVQANELTKAAAAVVIEKGPLDMPAKSQEQKAAAQAKKAKKLQKKMQKLELAKAKALAALSKPLPDTPASPTAPVPTSSTTTHIDGTPAMPGPITWPSLAECSQSKVLPCKYHQGHCDAKHAVNTTGCQECLEVCIRSGQGNRKEFSVSTHLTAAKPIQHRAGLNSNGTPSPSDTFNMRVGPSAIGDSTFSVGYTAIAATAVKPNSFVGNKPGQKERATKPLTGNFADIRGHFISPQQTLTGNLVNYCKTNNLPGITDTEIQNIADGHSSCNEAPFLAKASAHFLYVQPAYMAGRPISLANMDLAHLKVNSELAKESVEEHVATYPSEQGTVRPRHPKDPQSAQLAVLAVMNFFVVNVHGMPFVDPVHKADYQQRVEDPSFTDHPGITAFSNTVNGPNKGNTLIFILGYMLTAASNSEGQPRAQQTQPQIAGDLLQQLLEPAASTAATEQAEAVADIAAPLQPTPSASLLSQPGIPMGLGLSPRSHFDAGGAGDAASPHKRKTTFTCPAPDCDHTDHGKFDMGQHIQSCSKVAASHPDLKRLRRTNSL